MTLLYIPHVVTCSRLPFSFPYLFCPLAPQPATSSLSVACLPERGALNGFGVPLATSPGTCPPRLLPLRLHRRKIHLSSRRCLDVYTRGPSVHVKCGPANPSVFTDSSNVLTWRARHVSLYMNFLPHGLEFHRGGRQSFAQGNLRPC